MLETFRRQQKPIVRTDPFRQKCTTTVRLEEMLLHHLRCYLPCSCFPLHPFAVFASLVLLLSSMFFHSVHIFFVWLCCALLLLHESCAAEVSRSFIVATVRLLGSAGNLAKGSKMFMWGLTEVEIVCRSYHDTRQGIP